MRNPLRSEAEAFRLVIITLAAFAAIAVAYALGGWVACLIVFLVVTVAAFVFYYRKPGEGPVRETAAVHDPGEYRLLVIANETVAGRELFDAIVKTDARSRLEGARRGARAPRPDAPVDVRRRPRACGRSGAARRQPREPVRGRDRGDRRGRRRTTR